MDAIGAILLIVMCFVLYFLPSFIGNNKKNSTSIIILNLFLGWTLIGWVVALVWALAHEEADKPATAEPAKPATAPPASVSEELLKLDELRQKGIITQAEFDAQKTKLLRL